MFKKQDRFESVQKFNPSPNAYDSYTSFAKMPKSIKTGSLKGPSESNKTLGSFGGVRRFTPQKNTNPGPGSYATIRQKQQIQQYDSLNAKKRTKSLANFQLKKNLEQNQIQMYMGKPPEHIYSQYQIIQNNEEQIKPGYSFPKSRYKERETIIQKQQQPIIIFKPALKQQDYESLIKIKQENRKRKLQLIQMMLKKQIPKPNALSLQYKRKNQQKPLPGPGAYTINTKTDLTQSSAFKSKIQKSLQFNKHISELVGPGTYTIKQFDKTPSYCFNRQQRKTSLIENTNLPCQFYNKDVQSKKSFNKPNVDYQAPFGSGTSRFNVPVTPQISQTVYKSKSKSRRSTRYQDSQTSQDNNNKPLHSIQILTDFYRNK